MLEQYNLNSQDKVLLDSNLLIAYSMQIPLIVDFINSKSIKCVSPINIAESLILHKRRKADKKIALIEKLLLTLEVYDLDLNAGNKALEICSYLSSIGRSANIVTADHYIAAIALENNLILATTNKKDFEYIPNLRTIWFEHKKVFDKKT